MKILRDNGSYSNNQLVLPMLFVFVNHSPMLTNKPCIYDEAIINPIFLDMITRATSTIGLTFRGINIIVGGKPSRTIIQEAQIAQEYRIQNLFLFKANHSIAFFEEACQCFIKSQIIDFIQASIEKCPILELSNYYKSFLSNIKTEFDIQNHAIPHIASSILLNSTPPESYGMLFFII